MGSSGADEGTAESSEGKRRQEDELLDCCLCWSDGELQDLFSLSIRHLLILMARVMRKSMSAGRSRGANSSFKVSESPSRKASKRADWFQR